MIAHQDTLTTADLYFYTDSRYAYIDVDADTSTSMTTTLSETTYYTATYIQNPKKHYEDFKRPIKKQNFERPQNDNIMNQRLVFSTPLRFKILRCDRKGIGLRLRRTK
jgi:hypothetical protein